MVEQRDQVRHAVRCGWGSPALVIDRRLKLGRANGKMFADGEHVYTVTDMKVGLSQD